jgi:hypothetical protein
MDFKSKLIVGAALPLSLLLSAVQAHATLIDFEPSGVLTQTGYTSVTGPPQA